MSPLKPYEPIKSYDKHCQICNRELTNEDYLHHSIHDFIKTCNKHKLFTQCYTKDIIRKGLGYITQYPPYMHNCQICDTALTQTEINAIKATDTIVCCTAHAEVRNHFQIDIAKHWMVYKYYNKNAYHKNDTDLKNFYEWRRNKYAKH